MVRKVLPINKRWLVQIFATEIELDTAFHVYSAQFMKISCNNKDIFISLYRYMQVIARHSNNQYNLRSCCKEPSLVESYLVHSCIMGLYRSLTLTSASIPEIHMSLGVCAQEEVTLYLKMKKCWCINRCSCVAFYQTYIFILIRGMS